MSVAASAEREPNPYAGWIAGGLIILAILAVGATLWFSHHPW